MRLFAEGAKVDNETESKHCECINECEMISFSSAISSSQLSTKTVLSTILHSSDIPERFIAATETRHRVEASLMMPTVSLLTDAVAAQRQLRRMINTHVTVTQTSITTRISRLLTSIGDMMRGHIADSISSLSVLKDVYLKHVNYLATGLSSQLQDCESLTAEAHVIAIRAQSTVISTTEAERLQLLQEKLEYLLTSFIDFDSMLDKAARNSTHKWHYFPDRLLTGDCNTIFQSVNNSLQYQINWLDTFSQTVGSVVQPVNAVVFTNMTNLRNIMASLSECLMSYKQELDSFNDEMTEMSKMTFTIDFSYEPPATTLINFQKSEEWLDAITELYIANRMSKKALAETIASEGMSKVTNVANRLYSDIELSLFTKLSILIDEQEARMVSFYSDLLPRFTSLQRYMFVNDTSLEQSMRRLSIWRMPIVNFQNSKVFVITVALCFCLKF